MHVHKCLFFSQLLHVSPSLSQPYAMYSIMNKCNTDWQLWCKYKVDAVVCACAVCVCVCVICVCVCVCVCVMQMWWFWVLSGEDVGFWWVSCQLEKLMGPAFSGAKNRRGHNNPPPTSPILHVSPDMKRNKSCRFQLVLLSISVCNHLAFGIITCNWIGPILIINQTEIYPCWSNVFPSRMLIPFILAEYELVWLRLCCTLKQPGFVQ